MKIYLSIDIFYVLGGYLGIKNGRVKYEKISLRLEPFYSYLSMVKTHPYWANFFFYKENGELSKVKHLSSLGWNKSTEIPSVVVSENGTKT